METSLCSLAELSMLGLAALLGDPSTFYVVVNISMGAVLLSFVVYTSWMLIFHGKQKFNDAVKMNHQVF